MSTSSIAFPGADDAGGRDIAAGDPASASAAAMARRENLETDTFGLGSVIGDLLDLPPVPAASSKHTGPVG